MTWQSSDLIHLEPSAMWRVNCWSESHSPMTSRSLGFTTSPVVPYSPAFFWGRLPKALAEVGHTKFDLKFWLLSGALQEQGGCSGIRCCSFCLLIQSHWNCCGCKDAWSRGWAPLELAVIFFFILKGVNGLSSK